MIPAFDDDLPNVQRFGPEGALAEGVGAEWVCSVHAADPVKFANTIEADGFQSCSGTGYAPQRINVVLQEYNGLGFWNNLQNNDSGDVWVNFVQRDFIFNCAGKGTETYRIITDGYAAGGSYFQPVQSANYLVATC